MIEPISLTLLAAVLFFSVGLILASDASKKSSFMGAAPIAMLGAMLFFMAGLQVHQSAQKQATIQCKTAQCPYVLKVHEDSSRTWVDRE